MLAGAPLPPRRRRARAAPGRGVRLPLPQRAAAPATSGALRWSWPRPSTSPTRLGEALRDLLLHPPPIDVDHMHVVHPRVSVAAPARPPAQAAAPRLVHLRRGGARGRPGHDRHHAVRPARAPQAGRGDLGAARALRRDHRQRGARRDVGRPGSGRREGTGSPASRRCCSSPTTRSPCPSWPTRPACSEGEIVEGLARLRENYAEGFRGIVLREVAGGFTLATDPSTEPAARRLLAKPRTPPLTPAQAETLAIVGYLQPVSRPEIARIRGVASESATATLHERGLIEEHGRSQFGAILYRTTDAVPAPVRPALARRPARRRAVGPRRRRRRASCATASSRARRGPAHGPRRRTRSRRTAGMARSTNGGRQGWAGELTAGRVDVAAAGQAHGRAQAVLLAARRGRRRWRRGWSPRRARRSGCRG